MLQKLPFGSVIVQRNGMHGADRIAETVARDVGLQVETFTAKPHLFGRKADLERDREMLDGADKLIVFRSLGVSMETDRLIWLAAKKGVDVTVYHDTEEAAAPLPLARLQGL